MDTYQRLERASEWPPLTYETLPWETAASHLASRRDRAAQKQTYQAAIPPAIADLDPPMRTDLAAALEDAASELSRFDAELGTEIAPFSAILLRSESAASSRIENLTASARSIAMAELGDTSKINATMITANSTAMRAAIALTKRLDSEAILTMHRALLEATAPDEAGRWRREQVRVGGSDLGPAGADYIAPHHSRVPAAIDDLVAFMARDDMPVLAHAAVAHAQFETIHPFTDGNGRTGRSLLQAMLRAKALTRNVTVPISAGLLARTDDYYDALGAYRRGDLAPLLSLTASASFAAVENARQLVDEVRMLRASWQERVTARPQSRTWDVLDLLTRHPVVNPRSLHAELGLAPGHVRRHMDPLTEAGIVQASDLYRKGVFWRAQEVLDALDRFAERAGRRRRG